MAEAQVTGTGRKEGRKEDLMRVLKEGLATTNHAAFVTRLAGRRDQMI